MISGRRVYDIVNLALREIGVVSLGDSIPPDVAQEALLVLNTIRAGYSLTGKNNELYDETFTAPGAQLSITLGTDGVTAGDIATRPAKITQVVVINGGASGINIPIPVRPYTEYRRISVQNVAAVPTAAYIDTGYPYQTIWFFPGLVSGWAVRVQGLKYLDEYELLDDPYIDPPEYFAVLYLDLALRLAPKFGVDLPPAVYAQLKSVLRPIKSNIFKARLSNMPNGLRTSSGGLNFWSGLPNA